MPLPHDSNWRHGMSRKLNILVVDDDAENAESLAELFAMDDHKVIVAYDGQQAIEAFSLNKVDIGFFDVMMPGKNGVESFIEIKQAHPEAQVYFMTGYSADDLLKKAMENGALGVFGKPVDLPNVLKTIEKAAA
jgi:DNA-binding NtrC family response regulator